MVAPLGAGGMATVWKAEDTVRGGSVALKVLNAGLAMNEESRRRFLREARIGTALHHPSIAEILSFGEADGVVYIAFAWIDGSTLTDHAARGPLEPAEIVRIGIAVGEALAHADARGVTHRDVTGRNVMIARDGRVFVLDFGLALARDLSRLTPSGTTLGTAGYMAPEVAQRRPGDARSDVYGLGVVLYEAATGSLPYRASHADALLYAALHAELEPPSRRRSDLSPDLERIILRAMARDPADRYPTAAEMVADLERLAELEPPAKTPRAATESVEPDETVTIPSPLYLAVVPFSATDVEEGDPEEVTRIALGVSDSIAAALGEVESIHVIPPDMARNATSDDPRRLARELGANLLLRGSVRATRTLLRVSYSLFHPYRGVQLAAQTLEGTRAELFLLEDRLFDGVVRRLGKLAGDAPHAPRPRPDPGARERYLQALGYLQRFEHEASVDGAIQLLEALAASDSENATYQSALGRAYLYKYRLTFQRIWDSRAAQACHRALTLEPGSADVLMLLGELHLSAGRLEESIAEFETLARMRPDSAPSLAALANAYERAGRRADAERIGRKAIRLQPEYWGHHDALGVTLFRQGRFEEAAEEWREVTRLCPDNARGYSNLAGALFRLDRLEESVEAYRQSIRIEPVQRAFSYLGSALYWLGRHDEAIEALRTYVALRETDPFAWGNLGSAYRWTPGYESLAAEPLDRAIGLMRQHLDGHPGVAGEWAHLASWLANRGLEDAAAKAIEKAISLPSLDVNAMALAGSVFHVIGRRSDALHWLREAVAHGYGVTRLERNPALQGLQGDPEFTRIVDAARTHAGSRSTPAIGGDSW